MHRIAISSLLLAAITVATGPDLFIEASPSDAPRPLDLPVGSSPDEVLHHDLDAEELDETMLYFGAELEGDAFFWCLDKSGSMEEQGRFAQQQEEVIAAIEQLGDSAEFGVVAVSSGVVRFSPHPRKATPENRRRAIEWVRALECAGESRLVEGVVETLSLANFSRARSPHVIVTSDGAPPTEGRADGRDSLHAAIVGANWARLEIHAIQIGSDRAAGKFLLELAQKNGGTFLRPEGAR